MSKTRITIKLISEALAVTFVALWASLLWAAYPSVWIAEQIDKVIGTNDGFWVEILLQAFISMQLAPSFLVTVIPIGLLFIRSFLAIREIE